MSAVVAVVVLAAASAWSASVRGPEEPAAAAPPVPPAQLSPRSAVPGPPIPDADPAGERGDERVPAVLADSVPALTGPRIVPAAPPAQTRPAVAPPLAEEPPARPGLAPTPAGPACPVAVTGTGPRTCPPRGAAAISLAPVPSTAVVADEGG